jgi:hypothetical protein
MIRRAGTMLRSLPHTARRTTRREAASRAPAFFTASQATRSPAREKAGQIIQASIFKLRSVTPTKPQPDQGSQAGARAV